MNASATLELQVIPFAGVAVPLSLPPGLCPGLLLFQRTIPIVPEIAEALRVLFQFIHTLLPGDVATAALALVPLVLAVVRLLRLVPAIEQRPKWAAPALSCSSAWRPA